MNPLLHAAFPSIFNLSGGGWCSLRGSQVCQKLDWKNESKEEAYRRREASWRRMLVSQPPVCRLYVKISYQMRGHPSTEGFKFGLPVGLYMRTLYDPVRDNIGNEADQFTIEWRTPSVESNHSQDIEPESDSCDTDTDSVEIKKSTRHPRRHISRLESSTPSSRLLHLCIFER